MAGEDAGHADRDAVVDAMRRLNVESDRFVEVFSGAHGLHRTDMNALVYISSAAGAGYPLSPGQLGVELRLSSPATTALLDRLERVGHVSRERDTADRRRVVLRTREQGMRLAVEFFAPLGVALDAMMDEFGDDELRTVRRFLDRAVEVVEGAKQRAVGP